MEPKETRSEYLRMRVVQVGYESEGGNRWLSDDDEREAGFQVVLASTEGQLPDHGEVTLQIDRDALARYTLGTIVELRVMPHAAMSNLQVAATEFLSAREAYVETEGAGDARTKLADAAIRFAEEAVDSWVLS